MPRSTFGSQNGKARNQLCRGYGTPPGTGRPSRRWQVRYSKKKLKSNKEVLLVYKYKNGANLNEI
jgi:hypothetical protein